MVYKGNYKKDSSWITTTSKWYVDNSKGADVWIGIQTYKSDADTTLLPTSELTTDINAAFSGGASGVVLFRYGISNSVNFNSLSSERIALFEKLVNSLKLEGMDVSFFWCPFHPLYYKRVMDMKGAVKAFEYVDDYARKNNIKIIGSFNPDDVGFKNTDFYDAAHARKEAIDKLFQK
jgi:hypothetical protein